VLGEGVEGKREGEEVLGVPCRRDVLCWCDSVLWLFSTTTASFYRPPSTQLSFGRVAAGCAAPDTAPTGF